MSSGPQISGVAAGYVLNGDVTPFSGASVADASGRPDTLALAFADPGDVNQSGGGDIILSDPSVGTDGSNYDATTGVYSVSGSAAEITTILQQLSLIAGGGADDAFTLTVTDGVSPSASVQSYVGLLPANQRVMGGGLLLLNQEYLAFTLADTGGAPDTIDREDIYGNEYTSLTLDDAQAIIETPALVTLASGSAGDAATFTHVSLWSSATGDDGAFTLDDALLAVFGADATVTFQGVGDQVSFSSPSDELYAEQVSGDGGVVILNHADVALTGDNDTIYFNGSSNQLSLTSPASGAWSALYASNSIVTLDGASLSIVGGAMTIYAPVGENAVSLYQTNGVDDVVIGDDVSVTLNQAQAIVRGSGDVLWFAGTGGSIATIYASTTAPDTAYGAGTIALESGAVSSVGGGALIEFMATGESATIAFTQGVWDRVEGDAGATTVRDAQVVAEGGNQTINFASGSNNAASVYDTNGNWDSVYGAAQSLIVNSAQVNEYGFADDIYLTGAGAAVSLHPTGFGFEQNELFGSNATIDVSGIGGLQINGGDDKVFFSGSISSDVWFAATNGAWDKVYARNQDLEIDGAQVSIFGGGDVIYVGAAGDAVSLYATAGVDDYIENGGGAITVNDATADIEGKGDWCYFGVGYSGGALTLRPYAGDDTVTLTSGIGRDTITGFNSSDTIVVNHTQFANFQAVQAAFQQSGASATLTLDAHDAVTFVNFVATSLTASQVTIT